MITCRRTGSDFVFPTPLPAFCFLASLVINCLDSILYTSTIVTFNFLNILLMSSTSENMSSQGIDVQRALEILSQRSADDSTHSHSEHQHTIGCVHHASEATQSLGQQIDLNPQERSFYEEEASVKAQQRQLNEEREKRQAELHAKLEAMPVRELVQAVLEAQQQRVQTYRTYDTGLDAILGSRNLSTYPQICAEATAQFAVISDTISGIQTCLASTKKRQDLAKLIRDLQQQEKEKLSLSAALHLERIRESQGGEERVLALMRQGIQSLEQKIGACMEMVSEVIEELQSALIDE
jgi:hypothetical protein